MAGGCPRIQDNTDKAVIYGVPERSDPEVCTGLGLPGLLDVVVVEDEAHRISTDVGRERAVLDTVLQLCLCFLSGINCTYVLMSLSMCLPQ